MFTVRTLVECLLVCGVPSLSHRSTAHTIGAKRFNLGFFVLMFVVSHILKILLDFKNILVCTQHNLQQLQMWLNQSESRTGTKLCLRFY